MKIKLLRSLNLTGTSMIELILAIALFTILAVTASNTVVGSFVADRFSEDYFKARLYAQETIEIVRNLKLSNWSNLTNGTYGLSSSGGSWVFSGSSDVNGIFTRSVTISDAYRDGSGNLAESGTLDTSAKRIEVLITWQYGSISKQFTESSYLAYWEQSLYSPAETGMLVYADFTGADDIIKYRFLQSDSTWGPIGDVPDIDVPLNRDTRRVELYSSPASDEKILLTKHTEDGQFLYAQVWDGNAWGNVINLTGYGDNTNPETRNFDGFYMDDGSFMIAYDDFTYEPKYRIWNGTSWSSEQSAGSVGAYPVWISVSNQPGSNNAMLVVREHLLGAKAAYWNGSSFGGYTTVSPDKSTLAAYFSPLFALEFVSVGWSLNSPSVGAAIYNEANDDNPNIRFSNNSNWNGSDVENQSIGDQLRVSELTPRPNSNQFMGCFKDASLDIECLRVTNNGSWDRPSGAEVATSTDSGRQRSFSFAYERSGDYGVIVYSHGSDDNAKRTPRYRLYNASSNSFGPEQQLDALGPNSNNALESVRSRPNPVNNNIMFILADSNQRVYTVMWDGEAHDFMDTEDLGVKMHGDNGSSDEDFWFDFSWGY